MSYCPTSAGTQGSSGLSGIAPLSAPIDGSRARHWRPAGIIYESGPAHRSKSGSTACPFIRSREQGKANVDCGRKSTYLIRLALGKKTDSGCRGRFAARAFNVINSFVLGNFAPSISLRSLIFERLFATYFQKFLRFNGIFIVPQEETRETF